MSRPLSRQELTQQVRAMRDCTCLQLRKASRAVTQAFDEQLQESGLRMTQITLLAAILLMGDVSISVLADELVMDRSTLTRNLKPLEKQGLISFSKGRDRREKIVSITDPGTEVLEFAFPLWQDMQRRMVEGLGGDQWQDLMGYLSDAIAQVQEE